MFTSIYFILLERQFSTKWSARLCVFGAKSFHSMTPTLRHTPVWGLTLNRSPPLFSQTGLELIYLLIYLLVFPIQLGQYSHPWNPSIRLQFGQTATTLPAFSVYSMAARHPDLLFIEFNYKFTEETGGHEDSSLGHVQVAHEGGELVRGNHELFTM